MVLVIYFVFRTEARGVNKALGVVWIVSAILLAVSIFITADEFEHREKIHEEHSVYLSKTNRQLYLQLDPSLTPNAMTENDEELLDIYDAFDNDFPSLPKRQSLLRCAGIKHLQFRG